MKVKTVDAEPEINKMKISTTHSYKQFLIILSLGVSSWMSPVNAEIEGNSLDSQCISCHAVSGKPAQTLKALWERKGPDLSSAGIKYKPEWLVQWLQNPVRIRPAGLFYGNHIVKGEKSDVIDTASLVKHPQLTADEAKQATEILMTLKQNQQLITGGDYKPGTVSMTLGEMTFDKFKGCLACHQIEPGYGGLSGPEVYTAASRLQEDYLISFMRNPQVWEPKSIMPNKHLKERDLQKIVHYLRALSKENFK